MSHDDFSLFFFGMGLRGVRIPRQTRSHNTHLLNLTDDLPLLRAEIL